MKHTKFYLILLMISISFNFLSCDNEPIDPALSIVNPVACEAVSLLSVSDFVDGTKVNLNWDANGDTFQIQYGPEGFALGSGTALNAADDHLTVSGLDSTKEYDFYIRNVCGATSFSEWLGPVSVGTVTVSVCQAPSNLLATRNATTISTVNLSWSPSQATQWEVQYGTAGFAMGSGTIATTTTANYQILGLSELLGYDFYVRSVCSNTSKSTWAGPFHLAAGTVPVTSDYWPTAINNQWVYLVSGTAQEPVKIISTNIVGGQNYFTFAAPTSGATATQRIRKSNGDYYLRLEQVSIPASGGLPASTTSGNETIYLKDYLAVGQTWTSSYDQTTTYTGMPPITMGFTITSTIEQKNVSMTVNGEAYSNVIKVKRVTSTSLMGNVSNSTGYYYFAKDVGPIQIENEGFPTQTLESYILN